MGLEIGKGWGLISGGTGRFEGVVLKSKGLGRVSIFKKVVGSGTIKKYFRVV